MVLALAESSPSPPLPARRELPWLTGLLVLSATLTWIVYRHTIGYGLDYDDYYFVRPYTLAEIAQTFRGSWDDSGIMVPFYRPLTIAWYALRFELFGIDSEAHHIVSLVLFALAAVLASLFVRLASGSRLAATCAAVAFLVHPGMPYAQVAWITNQMHLLASVLVLTSLVWAQVAARRGLAWWLPLLPLAAAAFLVKEDCIVLLPAIVAIHWLRRRIVDQSLPRMPWAFVALAGVLVVALVALRQELLGGLGGYGRPNAEQAWANYRLGLERVFWSVPIRRPLQWTASWFITLLPMAAIVVSRRAGRASLFTMAAGLTIALLFNAPFVFVTKNEQMHLVAAGAALVFGGSAAALLSAVRLPVARVLVATALAAGFAACGYLAWHISTDFRPFGPIVRSHDEIVLGWGAVPDELRDYVQRKNAPDAEQTLSPNPKDELRVIGFGFHGYEPGDQRWMRGPVARIDVAPSIGTVVLPVRHERGAFGEPTRVTITLNGAIVDTMHLDDGQWRYSTITLGGRTPPRLSGMHTIRIEIPHAWVPAKVTPGSGDPRTLGLQIGRPQLR